MVDATDPRATEELLGGRVYGIVVGPSGLARGAAARLGIPPATLAPRLKVRGLRR